VRDRVVAYYIHLHAMQLRQSLAQHYVFSVYEHYMRKRGSIRSRDCARINGTQCLPPRMALTIAMQYPESSGSLGPRD
jgi:hypothetical protein